MFTFAYYYEKRSITQLRTIMEIDQKSASNIQEYLFKIRGKGRYTFTLDELRSKFSISENAINQSLFRLKSKGKIAQVRQGFFVVIPPEYASSGILPLYFFIDQMMKWLDKPYYIGLLSAAALHGSSHQQPMESFIIARPPALRKISTGKIAINFLVKNAWDNSDIIQKKTEAGYINVSSPELTALDLLLFNNWMVINRATAVISELADEMKPSALLQTARRFPVTAAIQRLGYLLDIELGNEKLAAAVEKSLADRKIHPVPLSISKERKGEVSQRWKVIKNMEVESEI
jgi:predicted transcriptional regulator of viral defense system